MVDLGGLRLEHAVLNASGTLDARSAHAVLGDAALGCAAHVTKTITPEPRAGNAAPRIAEVPGGMINSIGLPGPGIDRFCAEVCRRPFAWSTSRSSSRWAGSRTRTTCALVERLTEIARCCRAGAEPELPERQVRLHLDRHRPARDGGRHGAGAGADARPLLVKLSPTVADVAELARAAEAGGATR